MALDEKLDKSGFQGSEKLLEYYRTLRLLSESTDDYLFLWDFSTEKFYFTGNIQERFALDGDPECGYRDNAWLKIVYSRDQAAWLEDINRIQQGISDSHNLEYRLRDREGNLVWISCRGKVMRDAQNERLAMIGRVSDSAFKRKIDSLTGLMNVNKLQVDLEESLREGQEGVLLVLGIDDFKNINNKYGRGYGNQVLKNVAAVLENCVDDRFLIYRLDGDRFAINLTGYHRNMVVDAYQQIQGHLTENITMSAGAVKYPVQDVTDANTIYLYAENSLDQAKKEGKNRLIFFSAADYEKQLHVIELTEEIRRSVNNDFQGFTLYYQPQISMRTFEVQGAEALLRYQSENGMIYPGVFIEILEKTGLIVPVGRWVLKEAICQCKKWREYHPDFHMSINLSYVQLKRKGLTEYIFGLLDETGVPGDAIVLELTESMQLQDYTRFNQIFYQWGRRGIQISIDDFGTGYSSLSYIKNLAIDEIKIDRCFVNSIHLSAYNFKLLKNILELAKSAQIRVCCEGVETVEEILTLKKLAPEILQGYFFSKPVEVTEFETRYLWASTEQDGWKETIQKRAEIQPAEEKFTDTDGEFRNVLEQLDEIVVISDVDTHEVYYLNAAGKRFTGVTDFAGKKCYQILWGRNTPCENCIADRLKESRFTVSHTNNEYLNSHLMEKNKLIQWEGKTARLEIGYDLAIINSRMNELEEDLCVEENVVGLINSIDDDKGLREAIGDLLEYVGRFHKAESCQIYLYSKTREMWSLAYGWEKSGQNSLYTDKFFIPERYLKNIIEEIQQSGASVIRNIDVQKKKNKELWGILEMQDVDHFLAAPLRSEGKIFGFLAVNNSEYLSYQPRFLKETADFIQKLLIRGGLTGAEKKSFFEMSDRIRRDDILEKTKMGLWIIELDSSGKNARMFVDREMTVLLDAEEGLTPEEYYHLWYSRIENAYCDYVNKAVWEIINSANTLELQYVWNHPSRGQVLVRCVGVLCKAENGIFTLKGYHRILGDMVQRSALENPNVERQLVRKDDFYHAVLSETTAYMEVDLNTGFILRSGGLWSAYQKKSYEGMKFQDMVDQYIDEVIIEEDRAEYYSYMNIKAMRKSCLKGKPNMYFQFRRKLEDGNCHWMELVIHVFQEQMTEKMYALLYLKDIDSSKRKHLAQERAASTDPLTNALNRKMFESRVTRYMEKDAEAEEHCALIMLDIDDFKMINDTYGHQTGDEVIMKLVDELRDIFQKSGYIGRLGGDEFMIFLKKYPSQEFLDSCLTLLQTRMRENTPSFSCSMGISLVKKSEFQYGTCLRNADSAMYQAKRAGKDTFRYWKE